MFKKNNLFLGILYGLIVPVLAWLVFAVILKNETVILDKPVTPYLIAIGINLVMLRFSARAYLDKTSNGIMIATFACTLLIFVLKVYAR
ncbi:MAG: hypothetical protein V4520_12540 [Bacteroidota bacterium]